MPHYKDGTEAKVGDHVRGKPYNTPHEVAAVVVSISPGAESCNMIVAFLAPQEQSGSGMSHGYACRPEDHGSKGDPKHYYMKTDYCGIGDFALIARP